MATRNRILADFASRVTSGGSNFDSVSINSLLYPLQDGSSGQFITTDGTGNLSFDSASGGGGGGGASVTTSTSAPGSPSDGDLWFDEENGLLLIYYDDGNGDAQWVSFGGGGGGGGLDSAATLGLIDSAYIQARAGSPTTIQPAATSSTDTQVFPLFVETSNTNEQDVKIDGGFTYNSNTNVVTSNGGFVASGVIIDPAGSIELQNTGTASYIDLYCEVGNAHFARLQSGAHADYSGNATLTLPTTTTTLAGLAVAQTFSAAQTFSSTTTFTGTASFNGDVNLGNASGDTITFNGTPSFSDITATGTVTAADFVSTSDRRLKENIETIQSPLFKVQNLRGVSYTKNSQEEIGVIAQEVETVLPEVVRSNEDGYKSVAYGNMVGLLIEAMKEQQEQIEFLKEEINRLKGV